MLSAPSQNEETDEKMSFAKGKKVVCEHSTQLSYTLIIIVLMFYLKQLTSLS